MGGLLTVIRRENDFYHKLAGWDEHDIYHV